MGKYSCSLKQNVRVVDDKLCIECPLNSPGCLTKAYWKALTVTPNENWWNLIDRTAATAKPAESDYLASEIKMLYKATKNTSTTALRTAPRRSDYLSSFLLLALFRAPRQNGEAWSKFTCFTFRAHFLVCYCILSSKIAFKTLFYRADTDYWVCLCLNNT